MRSMRPILFASLSLMLLSCSKQKTDSPEPATSQSIEAKQIEEKGAAPPADKAPEAKDAIKPVILATTTSTHDSGLLDALLPTFEEQTGITVKTIAVGTGQALEMGRRGEADVLLVHAPPAEEKFVADGLGTNRKAVMHNDFIVVGPKSDPAGVQKAANVKNALESIAKKKAAWVSRGDRSGTHQKEQQLWKEAGIEPKGDWYIESGQGMGATLRIASEKQAYTLADRGTFLAIDNLNLAIASEGDEVLFNPYHVMEVTHQNANKEGAMQLAAFFVKPETQKMIEAFRAHGKQLFTPDAL